METKNWRLCKSVEKLQHDTPCDSPFDYEVFQIRRRIYFRHDSSSVQQQQKRYIDQNWFMNTRNWH